MTSVPEILGIRTRLNVVIDRLNAGVPFYWHADPTYLELGDAEIMFMGLPVDIIDRDGQHLVLQLREPREHA